MADTWAALAAERQRFVDALASLPADAWDKPSLCAGWTVRDTVAHIVAGAKNTPPKFLLGLIASGFNFDKFIAKGLAKEKGQTPQQLIAALTGLVDKKTIPGPAMLGEIIVHGEDVRRAVGLAAGPPEPSHVQMVADAYKKAGPPLGSKKRIAGLTLKASDADWSTGSGPEVTGPLLDLVMAMGGRSGAFATLSGPGLETLKSRR